MSNKTLNACLKNTADLDRDWYMTWGTTLVF